MPQGVVKQFKRTFTVAEPIFATTVVCMLVLSLKLRGLVPKIVEETAMAVGDTTKSCGMLVIVKARYRIHMNIDHPSLHLLPLSQIYLIILTHAPPELVMPASLCWLPPPLVLSFWLIQKQLWIQQQSEWGHL